MNMHPDEIPFVPEDPQPLLREIGAPEPYPVEALGSLRAAVEAVQGMTQAPIAIPAQSALAVASLAVQGHADVETLGGPRPTSLNLLTIAKSGERKSSCDSELMRALRLHEMERARFRRHDLTNHQNKLALWRSERERILGDAKIAKGEMLMEAEAELEALGSEPTPPPVPDRTVSEPTIEGLTRKFAEGMPSLGIFSDEGGQFLGGYSMKSENRQRTQGGLNKFWDGAPIDRTRASEANPTLFGRRLTIHLMVQPGVAEAFLSDPSGIDIGFLPRFLICAPRSTIGTRLHAGARHDNAALEAFGYRLREILDVPLPMDAETRELSPRLLPLTPEARALLIEFSDTIERAQAPGGDLEHLPGFASKAAEQAARIAGVLTLFRDLHAWAVMAEDMANAIELAQFYLSEAKRLLEAASVSREIRLAEVLRRWLLEDWRHPEIMPSEVVQRGPNQLRETPKAKATLILLERHGWVVSLPKGTEVRGKLRNEAYRIVRPHHVV